MNDWERARGLMRLRMDMEDKETLLKSLYTIINEESLNYAVCNKLEDIRKLLEPHAGSWDMLRDFAPDRVAEWERLKRAMDEIRPDDEQLRTAIYKINANLEPHYEHIDNARRLCNENEWNRLQAYITPEGMHPWNRMKDLLLAAQTRLNSDDTKYKRFLAILRWCKGKPRLYVPIVYRQFGAFDDVWRPFAALFPEETQELLSNLDD